MSDIDLSKILGQNELVVKSLLNQENLKAVQNFETSGTPSPPNLTGSLVSSRLIFSDFPEPQINLKNIVSMFVIITLLGFGITRAIWLSFDKPSDFTTITFPKGVRYMTS